MYIELFKRNQHLFYATLLLGIFSYGFLAFNNVFTGDNWMGLFHADSKNDLLIKVGRWLQVPIGKLQYGRLFAPSVTAFVFIVCLSISSILLSESIGFIEKYNNYVFSFLFISFPFWNEAAVFNMIRIPIGIALLLSCTASFIFLKTDNNKWNNLTVVLLLWLSISIYQTYVFFFICSIIAYSLVQLQSANTQLESLLRILKNSLIIITLTGLIYFLSVKLSLFVYDLDAITNGKYSFFDNSLDIYKNLKETIIRSISFWVLPQILLPSQVKYLLAFFLIITLLCQFRHGKSDKLKIFLRVLLLLALILTPWLLGIIKNESVTYRYNAMTPMALVVSFIISFALKFSNSLFSKYKCLLYGLVFIIIANNVLHNNACHYALYLSNARDLSLSQELLTRVHSFDDYDVNNNYTLKIYGKSNYRKLERPFDMFQPRNIFTGYNVLNYGGIWDLTSSQRWNDSFKMLGEQSNFNIRVYHKNVKYNLPNIRKIKPWPNKNALIFDKEKLTYHLILE